MCSVVISLPFLFLVRRRPPRPPLFPYTTLFRSHGRAASPATSSTRTRRNYALRAPRQRPTHHEHSLRWHPAAAPHRDRKSTRLNSSHVEISYAVFCLKKKKKTDQLPQLDSDTHL